MDDVRSGTSSNNFASGHYTVGKEIGYLVKGTHRQHTVAEYFAHTPIVYAAPAHVTPAHVDEYIARGLQCTPADLACRRACCGSMVLVAASSTALCHAFKSLNLWESLQDTQFSVSFCGPHPSASHTRETVGGARYA